jgi:hypothetical protein
MRATEFLLEAATDIVYHYTSIRSAQQILKDGAFKLSSVMGNKSEEELAPAGYPYFLSTSRSKMGDYHRYVGTGGVMFVLDGRWLNQRYRVKPVDYWERSWQHSPGRTRETEDRVFSRESEMPIAPVQEIHVLLKEQDERQSPGARALLLAAKRQGIDTYFYANERDWVLQRKERAQSLADPAVQQRLRGQQPSTYYRRPVRGIAVPGGEPYGRSSILDWIELIKKQPGQALSKSADKLRYNIQYYGDHTARLKNDLFNARKPGEPEYAIAVQLVDYLNKKKISLDQLSELLKQKWKSR